MIGWAGAAAAVLGWAVAPAEPSAVVCGDSVSLVSNPFDTRQDALRVALRAFTAARARVADLVAPTLPEPRFVATTEALWWAEAVAENFRKIGQPNSSGVSYADAADADNDGKILRGVKYARNRGGHQLALMTRLTAPLDPNTLAGAAIRRGQWPPMSFYVPAWRPFADLPPPDPKHLDLPGQKAYKDHLADRIVGDTLEQLLRWFAKAEQDHL